jgi:hypothetical protein
MLALQPVLEIFHLCIPRRAGWIKVVVVKTRGASPIHQIFIEIVQGVGIAENLQQLSSVILFEVVKWIPNLKAELFVDSEQVPAGWVGGVSNSFVKGASFPIAASTGSSSESSSSQGFSIDSWRATGGVCMTGVAFRWDLDVWNRAHFGDLAKSYNILGALVTTSQE